MILAAEKKVVLSRAAIIKRLDAENIASAEQAVFLGIPNDESIHAAQAVDNLLPPLFVAMQQRLGIGAAMENVAFSFKLAANLLEVIDFAIEGDDDGFLVVAHRLFSGLAQVKDGQTAKAQRHAIVDELIAHIRPAMDNAIHHCRKNLLLVFDIAGEADKTAHRVPFVVKRTRA